MAQRDLGSRDPFETGLPPAQSGEEVPRWLVSLGSLAGVALLIALLRYAVDLLGVVFVIILVGFAIRAVSDWLTEGETVSGWAMSAVSLALTGTVLVGVWLVHSGDVASDSLRRLPGPVQRAIVWMESKGWGQRVLLSGGSGGLLSASSGGVSRPSGGAGPPANSSAPRLPASEPVNSGSSSAPARSARRATRSAAKTSKSQDPPTSDSPAPTPAAGVRVSTQLMLTASPSPAVVGRSVRFAARLIGASAEAAPTGTVVFETGRTVLGRAPVRNGAAVLVTLSLAIGDHTVTASYDGDSRHLPSQSLAVVQTVIRQ